MLKKKISPNIKSYVDDINWILCNKNNLNTLKCYINKTIHLVSHLLSYQSLALLLISTAHDLREINQGTSHVVTFGLLMGVLVLDLEGSKIRELNFITRNPVVFLCFCVINTNYYFFF